jgi:chromosome segregation ATPase
MKTFLAILVVLSLGVSAILFFREKEMVGLLTALEDEKLVLSKDVGELRADLEKSRKQVALALEKLTQRSDNITTTSLDLGKFSTQLAKLQNELRAAQDEMKLAREDIKQRDVRIVQLESKSDVNEIKVDELQIVLERLDEQINETKRKLANAEGDRGFLMQQLHRLETEKADLLKRWNDPKALRAQYAKVKEQSVIGQRIDWLRKGVAQLDHARGAERLLHRLPASMTADNALVTEIDSTGAVRILDPKAAGDKP